MTACIIPPFWILILRASSLFDVNVEKHKDPGDECEPYAFVQDLRWGKGREVLFRILALQFYSKEITQKKTSAAHTHLVLLTVIFLCGHFTPSMTSSGKKNKKGSLQAVLTVFITFFFFWLKRLSFKTQFKIDF